MNYRKASRVVLFITIFAGVLFFSSQKVSASGWIQSWSCGSDQDTSWCIDQGSWFCSGDVVETGSFGCGSQYCGPDYSCYPPSSPSYPDYPSYPNYPSYPGYPGYPGYPAYPAYPSYPGYPGYPGYPSYPSYDTYPGYATYPAYDTYPAYPAYPSYPSYATYPAYPAYPGYPAYPSYPSYPAYPPTAFDVTCAATPSPALLGQTVTWTATSTLGVPPYSYEWSGTGFPTPAPTSNPYRIVYKTIGPKLASVQVTDSDSTVVQTDCPSDAGAIQFRVNFNPHFEEF